MNEDLLVKIKEAEFSISPSIENYCIFEKNLNDGKSHWFCIDTGSSLGDFLQNISDYCNLLEQFMQIARQLYDVVKSQIKTSNWEETNEKENCINYCSNQFM